MWMCLCFCLRANKFYSRAWQLMLCRLGYAAWLYQGREKAFEICVPAQAGPAESAFSIWLILCFIIAR